jgi:macrodomain Ter protein organizer (MatP/YcbG family)
MSHTELEDIVAGVARSQDAAGVLMLIVSKNQRAEVVAAVTEHLDTDLEGMIQRLAAEIRAGGGVQTGRHMQQVPEEDRGAGQDLEAWRRLCKVARDLSFGELLAQSANQGVWFTQAQQSIMELACLVSASQAMRLLADATDCDDLLQAIREDNRSAGKEIPA